MKKTSKKLKIISLLVLITALNQTHTRAAKVNKGAPPQRTAADLQHLKNMNDLMLKQLKIRNQNLKKHDDDGEEEFQPLKIADPKNNQIKQYYITEDEQKAAEASKAEIEDFFKFFDPKQIKTIKQQRKTGQNLKAKDILKQELKKRVQKTPLALDALILEHQLKITPEHIYDYIQKAEYDELMNQLLTEKQTQIAFTDDNNKAQTTTPLMAIYHKYNKQANGVVHPGTNSPREKLIQAVISTNYSDQKAKNALIQQLEQYINQKPAEKQKNTTGDSDVQEDIAYLNEVLQTLEQVLYLRNTALAKERDEIHAADPEDDNWETDTDIRKIETSVQLIEQQRGYIEQISKQLLNAIPEIIQKRRAEEEPAKKKQDEQQARKTRFQELKQEFINKMDVKFVENNNWEPNKKQGPAVENRDNKEPAQQGDKQNKQKGDPTQQIYLKQTKLLVKRLLEADDGANISSEQITDDKLKELLEQPDRRKNIQQYLKELQVYKTNPQVPPPLPKEDELNKPLIDALNELMKQNLNLGSINKQNNENGVPTQQIDLEQIKLLVKRLLEADDVTNISSDQITDATLHEILIDPNIKKSIKNYLTAQQEYTKNPTGVPPAPPIDSPIKPQLLEKALAELMGQDPNIGANNNTNNKQPQQNKNPNQNQEPDNNQNNGQNNNNGSEEGNKTNETGKKEQEIHTSNTQPTKFDKQALKLVSNNHFKIKATEEGTLANKLQIQILELKTEIYKWIAMTKQIHIEKSERLDELNKQIEQLTKKLQKNSGKKMINSNKSAKTSN